MQEESDEKQFFTSPRLEKTHASTMTNYAISSYGGSSRNQNQNFDMIQPHQFWA
jgi:hypothetical protein